VAGLRISYIATPEGEPVVTSRLVWTMGKTVEPIWNQMAPPGAPPAAEPRQGGASR
jgi:hypothetical protein